MVGTDIHCKHHTGEWLTGLGFAGIIILFPPQTYKICFCGFDIDGDRIVLFIAASHAQQEHRCQHC